jgi:hypothetical protein
MKFPFILWIYETGRSTFSDFSKRGFAFSSVLEALDHVVTGKYEYNKDMCTRWNQLMRYLSSVYSVTVTRHVSGLLVARHQEVTMYICNKWYVMYVLVVCQLVSWQSTKTYHLLHIYIVISCWWANSKPETWELQWRNKLKINRASVGFITCIIEMHGQQNIKK